MPATPASTENPTPNLSSSDAAASQPPPTASKRKFDEIVTSLGTAHVSPQANKHAKCDAFESKPPANQLTSLAKRFIRAVSSYLDISLVLHYGCQSRWGSSSLPAGEHAEAKIHADVFNKMLENSPASADVIHEFWKDEKEWPRLQKFLRDAAMHACQGDTTSLKHKLGYLLTDPSQSLFPKINQTASKSDRGRNHPMLHDAIVPWPLRLVLNETEEPEVGDEPVPTSEAVAYIVLHLHLHSLTSLKHPQESHKGQIHQWQEKCADRGSIPVVLLRRRRVQPLGSRAGPFPQSVPPTCEAPSVDFTFLMYITTTFDDSGKVPKNCKARAHAQYTWSGEMIGYICGQARTMLSTSDWTTKEGAYNYERMFNSVVKLFKNKTDPWVVDTLAFYQRYVLGSLDSASDDDSENEDGDDSDLSAILTVRAARNTPSSEDPSGAQKLPYLLKTASQESCAVCVVDRSGMYSSLLPDQALLDMGGGAPSLERP
ncbi:hypothetical protein B0H16DRAFT_1477780 [Mycena metata]|uniref:Uncharacterized protein n=1 Tax=Mycena metata TaxID=1033252 RepID=A0AAD7H869_9AGAR|nr:hypothetical protein B0H16DRAFT_1477780 [Mycena metata]